MSSGVLRQPDAFATVTRQGITSRVDHAGKRRLSFLCGRVLA